jgi:outer membrane protein OmpA-like peptidoglycan-associated protein
MKAVLSLAALSLLVSGCATKEYVHEYVNGYVQQYVQGQLKPVSGQISALEGRVGSAENAIKSNAAGLEATNKDVAEIQATLKLHADRIARNEAEIAQLSKTAQDAVSRADAAGKLAQGKLIYEVVMTDEQLKFGPGKSALGKPAEVALNEFAAQLKGENKNVFIEIQGHTDSMGEAGNNLKLGEARAEAVRRHLNMKGGIPLHRMSVISYGESAPLADNKVRSGREQNRRVVLVVIH